MVSTIEMAGAKVGPGHPSFIVAEVGVNHNGSLEMARKLVDVAVEAGANAVKFQTFKAERLVTPDAAKADYQLRNTGGGESHLEMLRRLELSEEAHRELKVFCEQRDILFMSTPFDEANADFLEELGVSVFKIASSEITNIPFLTHVARKGKPVIVSTGMSHLAEVGEAVRAIREAGNNQVVLLQCVSNYPADPKDANVRAMLTMAEVFDLPVGYSDHTHGIEVALAAVALGACVIEKHFTLDRSLPGPDHCASMEPDGLKALVFGIRTVEMALGHGRKEPAPSELNVADVARKSLVAARDIPAGTALTDTMIAVKRPGTGLPPAMRFSLVGRKARISIPAGTLFTWEMLA